MHDQLPPERSYQASITALIVLGFHGAERGWRFGEKDVPTAWRRYGATAFVASWRALDTRFAKLRIGLARNRTEHRTPQAATQR